MDALNEAYAIAAGFAGAQAAPQHLAPVVPQANPAAIVQQAADQVPLAEQPEQVVQANPDENKNPWVFVPYRVRVYRDGPRPQEFVYAPPERVSDVEVEWVAKKKGSLRSIRKHAQARKTPFVPTPEGSGYWIYPVCAPDI